MVEVQVDNSGKPGSTRSLSAVATRHIYSIICIYEKDHACSFNHYIVQF